MNQTPFRGYGKITSLCETIESFCENVKTNLTLKMDLTSNAAVVGQSGNSVVMNDATLTRVEDAGGALLVRDNYLGQEAAFQLNGAGMRKSQ